jgi:hypothetical protein
MVVDSDVDEFPACTLTAAIACAASGDAVAHAAETAELLNVEMDDLAWFLALVAWMWLLRARRTASAFSRVLRSDGFSYALRRFISRKTPSRCIAVWMPMAAVVK